MKEKIQKYGGFMASMVVPNLGAFIAWGLDYSHVHRDRLDPK